MTEDTNVDRSKKEKIKIDPAISFFPFILIATTAVAVAIPLIYSSTPKSDAAPPTSAGEERRLIDTVDGTDKNDLFDKKTPLMFNTRDREALSKQFGVELEFKKLVEKESETWNILQENKTWQVIQLRIKEICFLVLSNQTSNDLKHAANLSKYGDQILVRMKRDIFSKPEYAEFDDFVVGINIKNLYKYTRPGAEEK
ncbi:hypothetical protein CMK19_04610 [Candidatus Poribacteria bacterium]|nr:hypothetical protein [Candidatus Poribacteria bacterium]